MWEFSVIYYFVGISIPFILAPGPDIIFLSTVSLSQGKWPGIQSALGFAAGNMFQTLFLILGLAQFVQTNLFVFKFIQYAGAMYLIILGIVGFFGLKFFSHQSKITKLPGNFFFQCMIMNLLNPKVYLFFIAFIPQFIYPGIQPVWEQFLILGSIFSLLVALCFSSIALMGSFLQRQLNKDLFSKFKIYGEKLLSFVYWGIAFHLIFSDLNQIP
jgi:threonine/homoserine/homoserine lactone efflux protein